MITETLNADAIWFKDIRVLLLRPSEIIPSRDQSDAERINAIVRLVLYCSLAVALIRSNIMYLVLGLAIIAIISLAFAMGEKKKKKNESYSNLRPTTVKRERKACSPTTADNPFSNATVGALLGDEGRAPACSYDTPGVAKEMRKNFNKGLFRNLDDVYEVENSQRQFYTMPVTTGAPDTIAFAEFLYGSRGKTCKEDPAMCEPRFASRD
ncbi:hypothetical protein ATCVMO0605SPH_544R [Acanthocystis turfacea Chlorella virus MO0605SPH]|uniref:Uncharacterized protein Z474R n=1 Tax=Chlorovirus heliozoae TaxID=322019 RepID=A7K984_9PHYC|nr:hypothetical protein ATCV1_Z474R [Acanthocystis turfacea chlorella virus 1]ABT16608.1 hypothetical protein ATCV1_Z474R [Acanthocystis turfacea chlorella virus 1]AGE49527.1 hypothetical protein ATCVCan0610SP_554R [Acanthocystis turfacea Chlorella virus Can0610SP]AGE56013.1 hypothetical protein ATCVMO0605SPH_544R [Acanthocystis turfacea Chlorella virus MO0605SPH]AGE60134.1 hypothetical protein ATCVWI0606_569R [Acanthocystis turfacea Chlorella virus WI0606]